MHTVKIMKYLYAKKDQWDGAKIKSKISREFLDLMKPGIQRV
jgi:hypothetical protein